MNKLLQMAVDQPWKVLNEVLMYTIKPVVYVYLSMLGVKIGKNFKFYGFPTIFRTKGSKIVIGDNFECRSWWFSNPLGINHPTVICTWSNKAKIKIGNDVGISGGSIVAVDEIKLGNSVLVGANSTIIDTDFHPTRGDIRYSKKNIKSKKVEIGNNVFIGMNALLLKGSKVPDNYIVPAGGVLR